MRLPAIVLAALAFASGALSQDPTTCIAKGGSTDCVTQEFAMGVVATYCNFVVTGRAPTFAYVAGQSNMVIASQGKFDSVATCSQAITGILTKCYGTKDGGVYTRQNQTVALNYCA